MKDDSPSRKDRSFIQALHCAIVGFFGYSPVQRWAQRHPVAYRHLNARLSTKHFFGLPLTLLVSVMALTLLALLAIVQDYVVQDPLVSVDLRITNLLYAFRSAGTLVFFYAVTLSAQSQVVIVAAAALTGILWLNRQRFLALGIWVALIPSEAFTYVAKMIFHRDRPIHQAVIEDSFSFPSGHATTVVVFYGFLAYLLIRKAKSWKMKMTVLCATLILIFLVDLSRLYLGVHYLSDVLAGDLVGLGGLILAIGVLEWLTHERKLIDWERYSSWQVIGVLGVVGVSMALLFQHAPIQDPQIDRPSATPVLTSEVLSLFDQGGLPRFTETLTDTNQEPLNIILVSPEACFRESFAKAGWVLADAPSWASMKKLSIAVLLNQAYPTAPMTPSFFNAIPHTYGLEKETDHQTVRARHHARFWDTGYLSPEGKVYVGTTSLDVGIKWGITHRIAPDIDTERSLLASDLEAAGVVHDKQVVPFVPPVLGSNFTGDPFFTDGQAVIMILNACK